MFPKFTFPLFSYLLLCVVIAVASEMSYQHFIIAAFLLSLPLIDKAWKLPSVVCSKECLIRWVVLIIPITILIFYDSSTLGVFALSTFLFAALPEEWFFRAYLQTRLGTGTKAIFLTSIAFTLLHVLAHGNVVSLLVFFPSLVFGWLYQKTNDLVAVILLHALSNIVYVGFLSAYFNW